ncbi:MAG: hypothetical protein GW748_05555 [Alphaproteobacteria bacterium]|nr:hypothetical protein [Alphaproteobacteria bacterium]NCQ67191.1 hypothetical protein [Alphaproteobacteria bacterium]NCT07035.1 hypothetical protein [Alphaproteobacteria bacterium]
MKALPTLIKLAQQRLNNQRLRLVEFEKKDQELKQFIITLRENLKFESERATQEPLLAAQYGQYAQQVEGQIAKITVTFEENKKRLIREQDRLAVLFKEKKVLDLYQDEQHKKRVKEQEDKTQKNIDEIASRLKKQSL